MTKLIPTYIEQALRIEHLERELAEVKEQLRLCNIDQFTTAAELAEATVKESLIAQRPWVGLTDEEITQNNRESLVDLQAWKEAVRWAESKLREKNT